MLETLGWVATAVFSASYFFRRQTALRLIQAAAACLWIIYGIAIGAKPVVVANLIVAGAAVWTSFVRKDREPEAPPAATEANVLSQPGAQA